VNAAPTPVDIPVANAAGKASTSWPSSVFIGEKDASVAVCALALVAHASINNHAAMAPAQEGERRRTLGARKAKFLHSCSWR
jgi:hypothetical protein